MEDNKRYSFAQAREEKKKNVDSAKLDLLINNHKSSSEIKNE
jgi:hypothetical protein